MTNDGRDIETFVAVDTVQIVVGRMERPGSVEEIRMMWKMNVMAGIRLRGSKE